MSEHETTTSRLFDVERFRHLLTTYIFGRDQRFIFIPTIDSTNTLAMQLARQGSEEGVVVLTDSQTAGKGRQGRHWVDVAGCNALSSTILRPLFPAYLLVMMAALAVVDAIGATSEAAPTIKWPNDVLIGSRKVAGILVETSHDRSGRLVAIVGIGVNVNGQITQFVEKEQEQPQINTRLAERMITLQEVCGRPISREMLMAHLLQHLETNYFALQQEAQEPVAKASGAVSRLLREQWRTHLSTLGRTVEVQQGENVLSGVAEDVNEHGELLLRTHSNQLVCITWGDVGHLADEQA